MKKVLSRVFADTLISGKSLFTLCLICSAWIAESGTYGQGRPDTFEPSRLTGGRRKPRGQNANHKDKQPQQIAEYV